MGGAYSRRGKGEKLIQNFSQKHKSREVIDKLSNCPF
jgi:hypothetical protein